MEILVINGDCIQVNTSANLCHLAYIRGLVDAGHHVTLLSADSRDYQTDPAMRIPESVESHTYYGVSLYEKLSLYKKGRTETSAPLDRATGFGRTSLRRKLIGEAKKVVLSLYGVHKTYKTFVNRAKHFHSDREFDCVLSLSTPVTSHLLAHELIKQGRIRAKSWIQIWEDPWYSDAYGFNGNKKVYREEKRLLSFAQRICYVSPLTLENPKKLFGESADKMFWQPLPAYYEPDSAPAVKADPLLFGYFGAYYPTFRDLKPFYQATAAVGTEVNICGDPSSLLAPTDRIHIHPRLPLAELKPFEDQTGVLVFLCNRAGGQIPGKIYQYSATDKTILFILDGTEEEKRTLREYFEPFNRYVFCENTVEDITRAINSIKEGNLGTVINKPLTDFEPKKIIQRILEEGMG